MMARMVTPAMRPPSFVRLLLQQVTRRARGSWHIARLGATILMLGITPSTYRRPWRAPLAAQVVRAAWPLLPWFTVLSAVLALVLIRIVLVAAVSVGLSQLALEMLVRVLVIELIPLAAALAVAIRVALPAAGELAALRRDGALDTVRERGGDPLRGEIAPRALAALFTVLLLAAASGVVALVLAYLAAHGFSPWAFERYTRLVGQVFTPAVSLVFALKTFGFAAAVSLLPVGSALHDPRAEQVVFEGSRSAIAGRGGGAEVLGGVRMFVALFVIEAASLAGSYW